MYRSVSNVPVLGSILRYTFPLPETRTSSETFGDQFRLSLEVLVPKDGVGVRTDDFETSSENEGVGV